MGFTCFSEQDQGCGAFHRTLTKAEGCCRVHEQRHDEVRKPVTINLTKEIEENYPPSEAARARRDAWKAQQSDSRRRWRAGEAEAEAEQAKNDNEPHDGGGMSGKVTPAEIADGEGHNQNSSGGAEGNGSGEGRNPEAASANATAGGEGSDGGEGQAQGEGQGEGEGQSEGKSGSEGEGEGQSEGKSGSEGEGEGSTPPPPVDPAMKALAESLAPHLVKPIGDEIIPAVGEAAYKAAQKAMGSTDAKEAAKEAREATAMCKEFAESGLGEIEKRIDSKLKRLDKARKIKVVTPEGEGEEIEGGQHHMFDLLLKLVGAGENVFMSGPAGSGKTTAAKSVAKALGMELIIQPVATDKFDATGFIDAGGTYRESAVYRWAKSEKPALLLIDEIDAWLPQALVALNPVLDNRIGIFPEGQFEIDARHRVISTANTWGLGADAEYCGRSRLDAASLDRFGARLDWGYDEAFEQLIIEGQFGSDTASLVVPQSQAIRQALTSQGVKIVWGPRQTIGLARRISAGLSMAKALEVSALASISSGAKKRVMTEAKKNEIEIRRKRVQSGQDSATPTPVAAPMV